MEKKPFITLEQARDIIKDIPTPFHLYDEKGIRENARELYKAFSWNKGYKEFFAVKATPNPYIMQILKEPQRGRLWYGLLVLHRITALRGLRNYRQ